MATDRSVSEKYLPLIEEIQAGNDDAFTVLWQRMERLVYKTIHETVASGILRNYEDDLISICMMAVFRAAQRYDVKRGARFTTYACMAVRYECRNEIRRLTELGLLSGMLAHNGARRPVPTMLYQDQREDDAEEINNFDQFVLSLYKANSLDFPDAADAAVVFEDIRQAVYSNLSPLRRLLLELLEQDMPRRFICDVCGIRTIRELRQEIEWMRLQVALILEQRAEGIVE